jgi:protein-L-isoaspartate(D-aspartate) O-methyltransferase
MCLPRRYIQHGIAAALEARMDAATSPPFIPPPGANPIDARNNMVDGQLRPSKVTDRAVLDAMRSLPREAFVPPAQAPLAYADTDVPIGHGRVLLAPLTLARLIQAAELPPSGKVLVLGAGYAAAVFAAMGAQVIAVEQDPAIAAAAAAALRACAVELRLVEGPFAAGWAEDAPYDAIFVDGAVPELPDLAAQLQPPPRGRLCAVVSTDGRTGVGVVAEQAGKRPAQRALVAQRALFAQRTLFDCKASLLPQMVKPPGFRF